MNYPSLVSLREVAPRDGWQKFKTVLPTEVKRELICSMIDYGARELEIGVFSSDPVRGRQYLDLEPLCQAVLPYAAERGVKVTALVESVEAAQRARALGIRHVDFFLSVSDAFGQGFGSTPDRAFATLEAIANLPDLQVQAALGAVFGCPFGDATPLEKTLAYAQRAMELLELVGMQERARHQPNELSGGQKQRVAIVRALCMHPEILLFDEVTAALDPEMVREVLDVMLDLAKQGKTMIIVTHEMQFARAIANRVIFLDGGKIVEEAAPAEFFDRPKTERAQRFLRTFTFDAVK